jgi:hypothetical protein
MTALNLFPARIRFVNDDGTLTPEAYRALQIVFGRVGGPLGDSGTDVFGNATTMGQASDNPSITDTTFQAFLPDSPIPDVVQQSPMDDRLMADIVQQSANQDVTLPDVVQPIANGINTTITTGSLVGKTITVQNGLITGFA